MKKRVFKFKSDVLDIIEPNSWVGAPFINQSPTRYRTFLKMNTLLFKVLQKYLQHNLQEQEM